MELPENLALRIISKHMWLAMGAGALPLPWVDMAALTALQIRMLQPLSENYHIPFSRDVGKKLIGSLLGAVIPTSLATIVGSALKLVPTVGPFIGGLSMPTWISSRRGFVPTSDKSSKKVNNMLKRCGKGGVGLARRRPVP